MNKLKVAKDDTTTKINDSLTSILKWYKKIDENYRCTLLSRAFFSFLTHLYFFTTKLGNEDDVHLITSNVQRISSRRWITENFITKEFDTPMIHFYVSHCNYLAFNL